MALPVITTIKGNKYRRGSARGGSDSVNSSYNVPSLLFQPTAVNRNYGAVDVVGGVTG